MNPKQAIWRDERGRITRPGSLYAVSVKTNKGVFSVHRDVRFTGPQLTLKPKAK